VHLKDARTGVLILGEDERSFLAAIRSFGRAGFAVDVAWYNDLGNPALASKYIRERIDLPSPRHREQTWLATLNGLVQERDYDFVLPCHDAQVTPLQVHRQYLALPDRYALIPDAAFAIASDKGRTHALARQLEIPVPEQRVARSHSELARVAEALGYPLYLKPPCSVNPERPGVRREVIRLDDPGQIAVVPAADLREGYLAQEAVQGRGVGVEFWPPFSMSGCTSHRQAAAAAIGVAFRLMRRSSRIRSGSSRPCPTRAPAWWNSRFRKTAVCPTSWK